jgi:actin-related protein
MSIREKLNKMETFFDTKEVTVIDNGSGYIKVGYAGEDLPRVS